MNIYKIILLFFSTILIGCATTNNTNQKNSSLTQGNVQMNIRVGETNKVDVLEVFGAPNITTRDGEGREVWTYQRAGQVSKSSSSSNVWSVLLVGGSSSKTGFESNSRMMTLIIKFNSEDLVSDFNSRTSNF